MSDLLVSSAAGLNTFRKALEVTSNNISNVNTDGYSRQTLNITAGAPQLTGAGYIGSGSYATSVNRAWTGFLGDQMTSTYAYQNRYKTSDIYSTQLNSTLGNPNSGVNSAMKSYFESWNTLANDPTQYTNRNLVVQQGSALEQQVGAYLNTGISLQEQVNAHLKAGAENANSLLGQIAQMNKDINNAYARSNAVPNDLMDKRDELVKSLSQFVDVKTFDGPNGMVDIYTGSGRVPLLTDNRVVPLEVDYGVYQQGGVKGQAQELWIHHPGTNQRIMVSNQIQGGELAGAINFRNEQLTRAQDEFGLSIVGMSLAMNAQSRQGYDQAGVRGGELFGMNSKDNNAVLNDPTFDGQDLQDYNDGLTLAGVATFATIEDQKYYMSSANFFRSSEQQAYRSTTNRTTVDFNVNLISSSTVTDKSLRSFVDGNGDGVSDDLAAVQTDIANLKPRTYEVSYDGTTYSIKDQRTGEPIAFNTVTDGGGTEGLEFEGLRIVPTDTPLAGDKFQIRYLNDGVLGFDQTIKDPNQLAYRGADPATGYTSALGIANNTNAANVSSLQEKKMLLNATDTIQGVFGMAASNVGTYHQANTISKDAQDALFKQLDSTKQSIAGVNLDEEAANLMKFQQAYQAAAQMMQASQKVFDILIGAVQ